MTYFILFLIVNLVVLLVIEKSIIGPASLSTTVWIIACTTFNSGIINYDPATPSLLRLLFVCFGLFYTGYYILYITLPSKKPQHKFQIPKYEKSTIEISLYAVGALLAIRAVSVAYGLYSRYGSISAIFANGDETYQLTRFGEWAPGIPVIIPTEMVSSFLISYRYVKTGRFDLLSIMLIFLTLTTTTLLQSRYALVMSLLALIGPISAAMPQKKIITIGRLAAILVAIATITTSRGLTFRTTDKSEEFNALPIASELASVAYYVSCGVAGLNEYLRIGEDEYSGSYTFNGMLSAIQTISRQKGLALDYEEKRYFTPTPTIIATAFRFLIDDFGLYVVIIFPAIGAVTRYIYVSSQYRSNSSALLLIAITYMMLGYSWMGLATFSGGFWLFMGCSAFIIFLSKTDLLRLISAKTSRMPSQSYPQDHVNKP